MDIWRKNHTTVDVCRSIQEWEMKKKMAFSSKVEKSLANLIPPFHNAKTITITKIEDEGAGNFLHEFFWRRGKKR